jgi:uncharacterized protein (DUF1330 family)
MRKLGGATQRKLGTFFRDRESAIAWYESPAYQALIPIRTAGLDCRMRLIG